MFEQDFRFKLLVGPIYSGKSEALIQFVHRVAFRPKRVPDPELAQDKMLVFTFGSEPVNAVGAITSHDSEVQRIEAQPLSSAMGLLNAVDIQHTTLVVLDNAHLFDALLVEICRVFLDSKIRLIVAGRDRDFNGEPYAHMSDLSGLADEIQKLKAVCTCCPATGDRSPQTAMYTQKLVNGRPVPYGQALMDFGVSTTCEPRCDMHFELLDKPDPYEFLWQAMRPMRFAHEVEQGKSYLAHHKGKIAKGLLHDIRHGSRLILRFNDADEQAYDFNEIKPVDPSILFD